MRKLTSFLFISLDGVVESPGEWLRGELYEDFDPLSAAMLPEQDAVLLGRRTYEEWSQFWPGSAIEPFSTFINSTPKHVVSTSLAAVDWDRSTLLTGDLRDGITALKRQPGRAIGVHGSISLVQSLLVAGLIDELRLTLCPVVVGRGRRLLSHAGEPLQLSLVSTQATPRGLQCMTYRPLAAPGP